LVRCHYRFANLSFKPFNRLDASHIGTGQDQRIGLITIGFHRQFENLVRN